MDQFTVGFLLGILIGEGHFGGDRKQPQITLRMHIRYENIFKWLVQTFPGSKLYGPYSHSGRNYYQWMVRGETLRKVIVPMLYKSSFRYLDPHNYARFQKMIEDYHIVVE